MIIEPIYRRFLCGIRPHTDIDFVRPLLINPLARSRPLPLPQTDAAALSVLSNTFNLASGILGTTSSSLSTLQTSLALITTGFTLVTAPVQFATSVYAFESVRVRRAASLLLGLLAGAYQDPVLMKLA